MKSKRMLLAALMWLKHELESMKALNAIFTPSFTRGLLSSVQNAALSLSQSRPLSRISIITWGGEDEKEERDEEGEVKGVGSPC